MGEIYKEKDDANPELNGNPVGEPALAVTSRKRKIIMWPSFIAAVVGGLSALIVKSVQKFRSWRNKSGQSKLKEETNPDEQEQSKLDKQKQPKAVKIEKSKTPIIEEQETVQQEPKAEEKAPDDPDAVPYLEEIPKDELQSSEESAMSAVRTVASANREKFILEADMKMLEIILGERLTKASREIEKLSEGNRKEASEALTLAIEKKKQLSEDLQAEITSVSENCEGFKSYLESFVENIKEDEQDAELILQRLRCSENSYNTQLGGEKSELRLKSKEKIKNLEEIKRLDGAIEEAKTRDQQEKGNKDKGASLTMQ